MREERFQSVYGAGNAGSKSPAHKHGRLRRRPSYFAMAATADEIVLTKHTPLGYLTKIRLIQRAQDNDTEATRIVWEGNARLSYTAANRLRVRPQLVADLIQGAQLAIPRAIRRFDHERLLEFSTYAYTAICREMQRQVCRLRFFVSLPPNLYPKYIAFRSELDRALTPSDWFDLRERMIDRGGYELLRSVHALIAWEPLTRDLPLATPRHCPAEPLLMIETLRALRSALLDLDIRERCVLEWRYGIPNSREHTLEEVGQILGLSRERVRQIQLSAEANIRSILIQRGFECPTPAPICSVTLPGPETKEPHQV